MKNGSTQQANLLASACLGQGALYLAEDFATRRCMRERASLLVMPNLSLYFYLLQSRRTSLRVDR